MKGAVLAAALVLSPQVHAQEMDSLPVGPEYFGLVCTSEMLARAIGEGFHESGSEGFRRRAGIAIGNGCTFIGPYTLPAGLSATTVTSWTHNGYMLTLRVSRVRNAAGQEEVMYGYVVSLVNDA
jgi:hypothetical protein